jgi:hypothetical protein
MLNRSKLALSLALVLAAASAATAATKHPVLHRHHAVAQRQTPAGYGSYGYSAPAPYVSHQYTQPGEYTPPGGDNFQDSYGDAGN